MLKYEDPPTVLVVHIGGNDIGLERTNDLCDQLKRLFDWISLLMPETVLDWSQILPRINGATPIIMWPWRGLEIKLIHQ